ncbi:MAG: SRPBCC family protein [Verrucomicrobiota bacterium]
MLDFQLMGSLHTIYRKQVLDTDLQSAWEFISSPANLDAITPEDMQFSIVSEVPEKMYDGLMIEYLVQIPLIGKQSWLSEIKYIQDGKSFVDDQRIGPYKFWLHYHEVSEVAEGIQFIDKIIYSLPLGPIGSIAHVFYVKNKLKYIFDYRAAAMDKLFDPSNPTA